MLIDKTDGHLEQVREFASSINMLEHFDDKLKQLHEGSYFGKEFDLYLYKDFAPQSFYWEMILKDGRRGMNGGLIFHGPHDGGGNGGPPTFSVNLEPCNGWSIHT